MESISVMQMYRHDIVGKFKDISDITELIENNQLSDEDKMNALYAIHEVLLKMILTSQKAITNYAHSSPVLVIHQDIRPHLLKLQVSGVVVRCDIVQGKMSYFYSIAENRDFLVFNIGKICAVLPIQDLLIFDDVELAVKLELKGTPYQVIV